MDEKEIDLEIERLQKMKKELHEVTLPRGDYQEVYYFADSEFKLHRSSEDFSNLADSRYSVGNYYLDEKAARKKAVHARFEAEVKAYLRALNDGKDYWKDRDADFYFIDGDIDICWGQTWPNGFIFKALESKHLEKAISKFGKQKFQKFFHGEM